jgi:AcrR family transcriptional regulator
MQPSIRALRRHLDHAGHPPLPLTKRQAETRARILTLAQCLMAEFGAKTIRFTALAHALRISPATLRFHFADHDALLAALLTDHLESLAETLAETPATGKNPYAERRAAYRAATRAPSGTLTEAHILLRRDRRALHPEERADIDTSRRRIATLLAGDATPRTHVRPVNPASAPHNPPNPNRSQPPITAVEAELISIEQIIARTEQLLARAATATHQPRNKAPVASELSQLALSVARLHPALFTFQQLAVRA